jgi:hypothetical protein
MVGIFDSNRTGDLLGVVPVDGKQPFVNCCNMILLYLNYSIWLKLFLDP